MTFHNNGWMAKNLFLFLLFYLYNCSTLLCKVTQHVGKENLGSVLTANIFNASSEVLNCRIFLQSGRVSHNIDLSQENSIFHGLSHFATYFTSFF